MWYSLIGEIMKKIGLIIILLLLVSSCGKTNSFSQVEVSKNFKATDEKIINKNNYVSYNGKLKVNGTKLVNQFNEKIILKGISSHGIQWYNDFINKDSIKILKNEWNTNVFRLAMYTEENGYITNKKIYSDLIKDIDLLISEDMYVIIDWHILSDGNPNKHKSDAIEFFDKVSKKYANKPNIIYEICNEPNNTSWSEIKLYATDVIKIIRNNTKDSIIIVGTNNWDQDVLDPINDRIEDDNVMYALHFYSGTHKEFLRERAKKALDNNLPLFVSEWGTSKADGSNGTYLEEAKKWMDFMEQNDLSWCNWSLTDKNESSAILKPGSSKTNFTDDDLSESGSFIKSVLTK